MVITEVINRKGERFEVITDSELPFKIGVNHYGYAYFYDKEEKKIQLLHRWLMGFPSNKIDHINRNRLDNRAENLREVDNLQNNANRIVKGWDFHKGNNLWRARVQANGEYVYLKYFKTEQEAERAYKKAHAEYFGEYSPYKGELI